MVVLIVIVVVVVVNNKITIMKITTRAKALLATINKVNDSFFGEIYH